MKGVQCYELFGGIALKIHTFSFFFISTVFHCQVLEYRVGQIETATFTNQEVGVFACTSMKAGVRKRR